jgi:hypothetical protein
MDKFSDVLSSSFAKYNLYILRKDIVVRGGSKNGNFP